MQYLKFYFDFKMHFENFIFELNSQNQHLTFEYFKVDVKYSILRGQSRFNYEFSKRRFFS